MTQEWNDDLIERKPATAYEVSGLNQEFTSNLPLEDIVLLNHVTEVYKGMESRIEVQVYNLAYENGTLFADFRIERSGSDLFNLSKTREGKIRLDDYFWQLEFEQIPFLYNGQFEMVKDQDGKNRYTYREKITRHINENISVEQLDKLLDPVERSLQYLNSLVSGKEKVWWESADGEYEISILNKEDVDFGDTRTEICISIDHINVLSYNRVPDRTKVIIQYINN